MGTLFDRALKINRDLRFIRRFWNILEIIASYGYREFIAAVFPGKKLSGRRRKPVPGTGRPEQLCAMLEELGPAFVKAGQILSSRPDLIGGKYASALRKLTEHVTPVPTEKIRAVIEQELGRKVEDVFDAFSSDPLGSASIGQVHLAKLRSNGRQVVVKVQRPDIDKLIRQDIDVMRLIAERMEEHAGNIRFQPVKIVEEFSSAISRELDYMVEAANLLHFRKDFSGDPQICIPEVFFEYTTGKVLVMEYIPGDSAAKVESDPALRQKYDLQKIADAGVRALMHQIFETGFFHADPHPGNIILMPDSRTAFIDLGMTGRISVSERRCFLQVLENMLSDDVPGMVKAALKLTVSPDFTGDICDLEREIGNLVDDNINLPLEKISLAKILSGLTDILNKHNLSLRPNLYLMFKALISIEQLGKSFHPGMHIIEIAAPFAAKEKFKKLSPRRMLKHFLDHLGENMESLQDLPTTLNSALNQLEDGKLSLKVEHHRLDYIEQTMYITGERISRSLLLTALILASALLTVAKIPPVWNGIPVLGVLGFGTFGILGVYALWSDQQERKHFLREKAKRSLRDNSRGEL